MADKLEDVVTRNERQVMGAKRNRRASEQFYPQTPGNQSMGMRRNIAQAKALDADSEDFNAEVKLGYSHGGMVKAGSPKLSAPCRDSKTIKCS